MYQGYRIIDADAHFYEPMDIWDRYTEPEYYEQRPRVIGNVSRSRLEYAVDGVHFTGPTRKVGVEQRYKNQAVKYGHAYDSWWSLESRLKDMDSYGWDLQVCLPTGGGLGTNISRKDLKLGRRPVPRLQQLGQGLLQRLGRAGSSSPPWCRARTWRSRSSRLAGRWRSSGR